MLEVLSLFCGKKKRNQIIEEERNGKKWKKLSYGKQRMPSKESQDESRIERERNKIKKRKATKRKD